MLLKPVYPYVPAMIAFCRDDVGHRREFYVMERIAGLDPARRRPRWPGPHESEQTRRCALNGHRPARRAACRRPRASRAGVELGKGSGYVARQVAGWSERYRNAQHLERAELPHGHALARAHQPDDVASRVIHNDYRFDNVVLAPTIRRGRRRARLGDGHARRPADGPRRALAYWVQADDGRAMQASAVSPTHLPGMLTRPRWSRTTSDRTGLDIGDWRFYEVYGLFRLAVIAQQIYQRYQRKQTRNPAFRHFWIAVNYLDWRCRRIIRKGSC
jgi:aminoglycoside phosphotransferase (APT) family kinase protein